MRRYRIAPVMRRIKANEDDLWYGDPKATIEVHLDERWEPIGLLDADGKPIEAYIGPDRPGFIWTQGEDDE
jgi:hypothetical protein